MVGFTINRHPAKLFFFTGGRASLIQGNRVIKPKFCSSIFLNQAVNFYGFVPCVIKIPIHRNSLVLQNITELLTANTPNCKIQVKSRCAYASIYATVKAH